MKYKILSRLRYFKDRLLATNKVLLISWTLCLMTIIAITISFKGYRISFIGFAESRETVINFSYPVQVDKIHVIPGQRVQKGELLAELSRSDLNLRLHEVQAQIEELEAQSQISDQLAGLNLGPSPEHFPETDGPEEPTQIQLRNLRKEQLFLEDQKKELLVFCKEDGVVGAVNYKPGEMVDPFTSILSVSPSTPSFVQGYINEKLYTEVRVGQEVLVASQADDGKRTVGRVASVGSRIVEFPLRLQGALTGQLWGREVVIEIPQQNSFLLGEKVQINQPSHVVDLAHATPSRKPSNFNDRNPVKPLAIPRSIEDRLHIEPSGLVYNSIIHHFMVISDDTDKHERPYIFLMDKEGAIKDPPLRVSGLDKVEDLESIFTDPATGLVYILSSQDKKADKKDHKARATLASLRFTPPLNIEVENKVYLRPLLLEAIKQSRDSQLHDLFEDCEDDLDIEGAFVHDNDLYLGLKEPLNAQDETLILKITDFKQMMLTEKLSSEKLSIWASLKWPEQSGSKLLLSDIQYHNDHLLVATTCKGKYDCGALWKVASSEAGPKSQPQLIERFADAQPEGLFFDSHTEHLFVTFDQGNKKAGLWTKIPMRQW